MIFANFLDPNLLAKVARGDVESLKQSIAASTDQLLQPAPGAPNVAAAPAVAVEPPRVVPLAD